MPDSSGLESLFLRLYLDRHIMARLAVDLRGRGYDVLTTEEAGKDTADDQEQEAVRAHWTEAIHEEWMRPPTGRVPIPAAGAGRQRGRSRAG